MPRASSQVGKVVDLGKLGSLSNFKRGDELIFGIFVLDTVPEPASLMLVVVGMSGLGLVSRTLFAVRCRENERGALR
jgi:hypothetical protein